MLEHNNIPSQVVVLDRVLKKFASKTKRRKYLEPKKPHSSPKS